MWETKMKLVKESWTDYISLSLLLVRLHTNTVENHGQNTPGLPKILGRNTEDKHLLQGLTVCNKIFSGVNRQRVE